MSSAIPPAPTAETDKSNAANQTVIAPGYSAGRVRVFGGYTQESNGTLVLEVAGTAPAAFDQLQISGTATLGGNLIVKTINGFTPRSGDSFAPLSYGAVNGSFDSISSNAQMSFGANGATMQVSGQNPPAPKALNIATPDARGDWRQRAHRGIYHHR